MLYYLFGQLVTLGTEKLTCEDRLSFHISAYMESQLFVPYKTIQRGKPSERVTECNATSGASTASLQRR